MAEPVILHEDKNILILDKPAGLAVHRATTEKTPSKTLASWLLEHYPDLARVGEDPDRPGIVHRLDKDTSGVMVVARTQTAFTKLKRAFKERGITKQYVVLVEGNPTWDHKTVELAIRRTGSGTFGARHPKDVATLPSDEQAQYRTAVTDFTTIKRFGKYSLLEARPKTGRTHQIRVHLKAIGLPVVGDALYAPKKMVSEVRAMGFNRHFLHAQTLTFVHPETRQKVTFTSNLAQELNDFLKKLKS